MRALIIGGTGHIGGYLTRALLQRGDEVTVICRGQLQPFLKDVDWSRVRQVNMDRGAAEADGTWTAALRDVAPELVVDLIAFEPASAERMVDALSGRIRHLVHCGTTWIYGAAEELPIPEEFRGQPLTDYGAKKLAIQDAYLDRARRDGFPATCFNPSQITGPGKPFITPIGNSRMETFDCIRRGEPLVIGDAGTAPVHHVHPSDLAAGILQILDQPDRSLGQVFNLSSPRAMTFSGFARRLARHFGSASTIESVGYPEWARRFGEDEFVRLHMAQPSCIDIRKAERVLGYKPRYSGWDAVMDAWAWWDANR